MLILLIGGRVTPSFTGNRASAELFGFSAEEAVGQNLNLIVPGHLRVAHWRGFDEAMANGVLKLQGRPTLTRALHKNGRKLYIEMTCPCCSRRGCRGSRRGGAGRHGAGPATESRADGRLGL